MQYVYIGVRGDNYYFHSVWLFVKFDIYMLTQCVFIIGDK